LQPSSAWWRDCCPRNAPRNLTRSRPCGTSENPRNLILAWFACFAVKTSTSVRKFPTGERLSQNHKIFDKQAKTATTNGVFQAKILQINIVQKWRFLYYFSI
jgi:hypothetical protein